MAERPFIYRFNRDLRLDDHAGLAVAASHGEVLPVLVIDSDLERRLCDSPRRAAFFCATVAALDAELAERGSRLVVRRGAAARAIIELAATIGAAGAAWSASYDPAGAQAERALQSELEERGLAVRIVHDAPVIPPEESAAARSPGGAGYRAFAPYFDRWWELPVGSFESPLLLRFTAPGVVSEPLPEPPEFGSSQSGAAAGPAVAQGIFQTFLLARAPHYSTGAAIPAEQGTSQLSVHLSFGAISARAIARGVRERLTDPFYLSEERLSLKLFLRALARRDFFMQLAWFHPEAHDGMLQEKMRAFPMAREHAALQEWRDGRTGFPLVDAGIRQLRETGWMHPAVRPVAASVLCFDLGVDWRVGRDEWNGRLIEDDPALATGNWQWVAGVGADMAQFPRIYNPERQRRRCDPDGRYARRWIEELRHVPAEAWHGRGGESSQLTLALFDRDAYPQPIVDHATAARAFLRRYRAFVSP